MIKLNVSEIYTPLRIFKESSIVIEKGFVKSIKPYWFNDSETYNFKDLIAAPGFVDTHIHGHAGYDVNRGSDEEITRLAKYLAKRGVTSFLPTTVSLKHEDLCKVASVIGELSTEDIVKNSGSRILGLHLEGPYINPEMKGAQNPEAIRRIELNELDEYIKLSRNRIRVITLAPEIEGGLESIPEIIKRGVIVSLGHSNASYEIASEAFRRGASRVTHIFNAMRRFHHRDPGIVGAAFENSNVFIEFIPDLIHLAQPVVKLVIKVAGRRAVAVTDAISATDLPDGEYELGGLRVEVREGVARLPDGTLAGSTLTMIKALKNLYSLGYSLKKVLAPLTLYPARSINELNIGCLNPGCRGDLILLNKSLELEKIFIDGEEIYTK